MNKQHWDPQEPADDTSMQDDDMPDMDMGDTSKEEDTTADTY